jgi:hypothetical protein
MDSISAGFSPLTPSKSLAFLIQSYAANNSLAGLPKGNIPKDRLYPTEETCGPNGGSRFIQLSFPYREIQILDVDSYVFLHHL